MKKIFTLFLLLLVVTTGAKAADITVKKGDDLAAIVNNATNGSTIYIEEGTFTITATMNILENKSLTIIGAGPDKVIINGDDKVQIFNIISGNSLRIEGVTLQGGNSNSANGGAIYSQDLVTLRDCVLKDNYGKRGGAIYSAGALKVINCVLINNQADEYGGAIFNDSKYTLIMNTTITANQAGSEGGGLSVFTGQSATVLNSIIVENEATVGKDIYNTGTTNIAYSAYGELKSFGTLNEVEDTSHSGITTENTFANPGNSLELLKESIAATKGTMTAYDGTMGYFYDKRPAPIKGLRSAEPRGWTSSEGNTVEAPDEKYLLTPLGNTIMGAVLIEKEVEPVPHHELTFLVDEGIRINPNTPAYHIAEGGDYTFYMYMNAGNEDKKPYVTVNNEPVAIKETQDGTGWVYRIPAVYENKTIEIVLQDLTDNLNPEEAGVMIYSSAGALIVDVAQSTSVTIYNITGQAVAQERVDNRAAFNLPKGAYIVRTDRGTVKAIVP